VLAGTPPVKSTVEDPITSCVAEDASETVTPLTSVALPGSKVSPFDKMTPPAVPVTYWIGTVVEAMVTTVAGKLPVGAGATRGIVVVDDSPRTTRALSVDCSERTCEE
jgi:hypothetical protein